MKTDAETLTGPQVPVTVMGGLGVQSRTACQASGWAVWKSRRRPGAEAGQSLDSSLPARARLPGCSPAFPASPPDARWPHGFARQ